MDKSDKSENSDPTEESAKDSASEDVHQISSKRQRKCPGCKLLHDHHSFGEPGLYCMGPEEPPSDDENKFN